MPIQNAKFAMRSSLRLPTILRKGLHASHGVRGTMVPGVQQRADKEEADYQAAIAILNQYQQRSGQRKETGANISLNPRQRTRAWLKLLKCDVEDNSKPRIIHVAGSKGKGTTCHYCNHLLNEYRKAKGVPMKIGCYTSPHLFEVRDRFMINNEIIPKWLFSSYVQRLHGEIQWHIQQGYDTPGIPKYPGFLALLAIYFFSREQFDVLILETGIGGETDSTNVFPRPAATGITSIGLDHVEALGDTVEKIAWHKAGIFKRGSPAFTVEQDQAILDVLRKRGDERQVAGGLCIVTDQTILAHRLKLKPDMRYQRLNAALAIALADSYLKSEDSKFVMTDELAGSLQYKELPGRAQVIADHNNTWFISTAHNVMSLSETISWYKEAAGKNSCRVLLFNHDSVRDVRPLLQTLIEGLRKQSYVPLQGVVFCTDQLNVTGKEKSDLVDYRVDANMLASLHAQKEFVRIWKELGGSGNIDIVYTGKEAVRLIREQYKGAEVLVTGSSYLSGGFAHLL